MITPRDFEFKRWKSGTEYENWVADLLTELQFKANRVGKNDCGVDIIAEANWEGRKHRFYIQCKHYNKPVGKGPIQEIFVGTAFHKDYGSPVVVTSNTVTYEARRYARELGVEIISDPEWDEFETIVAKKKDDNPNPRKGLFGLMVASFLRSRNYFLKVEPNEEENKEKHEIRQLIISEANEETECVKEIAILEKKLSQYRERAIELRKRSTLRSLDYE